MEFNMIPLLNFLVSTIITMIMIIHSNNNDGFSIIMPVYVTTAGGDRIPS
jgi:hypothetical protein